MVPKGKIPLQYKHMIDPKNVKVTRDKTKNFPPLGAKSRKIMWKRQTDDQDYTNSKVRCCYFTFPTLGFKNRCKNFTQYLLHSRKLKRPAPTALQNKNLPRKRKT